MDERPELRIGTIDRERAQGALSVHFSEGRLDMPEFEQRSSLVSAARTVDDLAVVFIDLPGGLPAALSAPRAQSALPARRRTPFGKRRAGQGLFLLLCSCLVLTAHSRLLFLVLPVYGGARTRALA